VHPAERVVDLLALLAQLGKAPACSTDRTLGFAQRIGGLGAQVLAALEILLQTLDARPQRLQLRARRGVAGRTRCKQDRAEQAPGDGTRARCRAFDQAFAFPCAATACTAAATRAGSPR
jgi:hypothetical protein